MGPLDCLQQAGYLPARADEKVFVRHEKGQLVLICSIHVDDIKLAGTEAAVQQLKAALEARYDSVEFREPPFEHTGIMHEQLPGGDVVVHQDHYIKQLCPLCLDEVAGHPSDAKLPPELHAQYRSLLGGVAWLSLTRADVLAFVSRLQRAANAPSVLDAVDLNKVLR